MIALGCQNPQNVYFFRVQLRCHAMWKFPTDQLYSFIVYSIAFSSHRLSAATLGLFTVLLEMFHVHVKDPAGSKVVLSLAPCSSAFGMASNYK